jgi:hypothetical protein
MEFLLPDSCGLLLISCSPYSPISNLLILRFLVMEVFSNIKKFPMRDYRHHKLHSHSSTSEREDIGPI